MKQRAFSLIELVVVVLILSVLATIVIPRITASSLDAKDAKCDSNVTNLIKALELRAIATEGDYPADQTEFNSEVLNSTTYFPHGAPTCPYGTAYTYETTNKTITSHNHSGGDDDDDDDSGK